MFHPYWSLPIALTSKFNRSSYPRHVLHSGHRRDVDAFDPAINNFLEDLAKFLEVNVVDLVNTKYFALPTEHTTYLPSVEAGNMDTSAHQQQFLRPTTPTRASHRSRFSMRFSLSSFLGGSSIYSNSPPLPNAVSPKPDRFRFTLNSTRDTRTVPTPTTVRAMRPRSSTRSLIDAAMNPAPRVEPLNAQRSCYGATEPTAMPIEEEAELSSPASSTRTLAETVIPQENNSRSHRTRRRKQGRKITKAAFKDPKVRSKAALAIAFGVTFFIGLAVCK